MKKNKLLASIVSLLMLMTLVFTLPCDIAGAETKVPLDKCKITFSKTEYTYTGNGITPVPKVTYKNDKLKKDSDYNIYYKDNVNVGTATVTLVGLGKYTGSTTATFSIIKGKQSITASDIKATFGDDPINIAAIAKNPLSYSSSNTAVAEVSPVGTVTIIGAGTAAKSSGENIGIDARDCCQRLKDAFGARGGGSGKMVQGSVNASKRDILALLS